MDKSIIGLLSGASALALIGGAQAESALTEFRCPARKLVRRATGPDSERG